MAGGVTLQLCVIWEQELRQAAKALATMHEASDAEWPEKARIALDACSVALYGLTDERTPVMIGAAKLKEEMLKQQDSPHAASSDVQTKEKL